MLQGSGSRSTCLLSMQFTKSIFLASIVSGIISCCLLTADIWNFCMLLLMQSSISQSKIWLAGLTSIDHCVSAEGVMLICCDIALPVLLYNKHIVNTENIGHWPNSCTALVLKQSGSMCVWLSLRFIVVFSQQTLLFQAKKSCIVLGPSHWSSNSM